MIWITADDVIRLHALAIKKTGGLDGLRDRGALESALVTQLLLRNGTDISSVSAAASWRICLSPSRRGMPTNPT